MIDGKYSWPRSGSKQRKKLAERVRADSIWLMAERLSSRKCYRNSRILTWNLEFYLSEYGSAPNPTEQCTFRLRKDPAHAIGPFFVSRSTFPTEDVRTYGATDFSFVSKNNDFHYRVRIRFCTFLAIAMTHGRMLMECFENNVLDPKTFRRSIQFNDLNTITVL